MDKEIQDQILRLCEKLTQNDITPTVAMVRAKSVAKISLQQAIAGLRAYQEGARAEQLAPEMNSDTQSTSPAQLSTDEIIDDLKTRLLLLEQENKTLTQRVNALEQKISKH